VKCVLLRLEGPMQSWGITSRFDERDTTLEPTKSGVVGLCAAALGIAREDDKSLQPLAALTMAVRVDRPGSVATDFQTAGGGTMNGKSGVYRASGKSGDTVISRRAYLVDASFLVALGSDDHHLVGRLNEALQSPAWPLFLGRRSFVPTTAIAQGVRDGTPEEVLASIPATNRGEKRVRMVVEVSEDGVPRNDLPISFASHDRRFATRLVANREVELPEG